MRRDTVSAPTISTLRQPVVSIDAPTTSSYTKPARGREVERSAAQTEPVADERAGVGERLLGRRGREDHQIDLGRREPGALDRGGAAVVASVAVLSSGPAMRRSRMPVRSTIHASDVSTRASRSWFVSRPSGIATPYPTIVASASLKPTQ